MFEQVKIGKICQRRWGHRRLPPPPLRHRSWCSHRPFLSVHFPFVECDVIRSGATNQRSGSTERRYYKLQRFRQLHSGPYLFVDDSGYDDVFYLL